jgi:NAD(P)-dependent dehydrogenase (short-subunit alcohol dehydrogenase family)
MSKQPLAGQKILITGAAQRIGQALALACAQAGADILLHYQRSQQAAQATAAEIASFGRQAWLIQADLSVPEQIEQLISKAGLHRPLAGLINNAAIFEPLLPGETALADWNRHLTINLTAPFLLSQAFADSLSDGKAGRIINILDWRALRPGADHFPYTISKAALAAMTRSLAVAFAPRITVNGLALGAILPPTHGGDNPQIIKPVPAQRWGELDEVSQALLFLLTGPTYITGEILHVDGGRHLI